MKSVFILCIACVLCLTTKAQVGKTIPIYAVIRINGEVEYMGGLEKFLPDSIVNNVLINPWNELDKKSIRFRERFDRALIWMTLKNWKVVDFAGDFDVRADSNAYLTKDIYLNAAAINEMMIKLKLPSKNND